MSREFHDLVRWFEDDIPEWFKGFVMVCLDEEADGFRFDEQSFEGASEKVIEEYRRRYKEMDEIYRESE